MVSYRLSFRPVDGPVLDGSLQHILIVDLGIRAGPIYTNVHTDALVVGIDTGQQNDAEEFLVDVVHAV